jgi:hypothetical protein
LHLARRCRRQVASGAASRADGYQKCSKQSILGIADGVGVLYLATPELLGRLGLDPATVDPPPADVLTGQTGELRFANLSGPGAPPSVQPIQVVSDAGMTVETRDHQTQLTAIRSGATAAGLLLALGTSP